jgi:hypothetical protein
MARTKRTYVTITRYLRYNIAESDTYTNELILYAIPIFPECVNMAFVLPLQGQKEPM